MANQKMIYSIGFNVDASGLQKLKSQLDDIRKFSISDFKIFNPKATAQELQLMETSVKDTANRIEVALEKSFNPKINSISLHKFREELKDLPLSEVANNFKKAGDSGQEAFSKLTNVLMSTKQQLKETSNWADKLGDTLANTIRWKVASGAIDMFTGGIQKAWSFAQKLDTSLNDIRIVTEKSNEEMEKFAKNANKAAKNLGTSTTNYTNASLIYYQQGLSDKDVKARTDVTVKAANVTGQSAAEVSEQLTAVWNGYKVVAGEAELYVDKLAAVAASTAADLEELSTGMSKVASAANAMGVDVDQLSAQLSTIISVTRQDASVVGTALKTIYSRMGDLKVDGVDEFGTSLGDVSGQLQQMGINVLDQEGNLRDMGMVIEEVAAKWGTWTDAQQQAAAVAIAGKRQYNNLIALFENWSMYESSLATSKGSAGTLQKQQEIYTESIEYRLKRLTTASEAFYDALINNESMIKFIDFLTQVVDGFSFVTDSLGGLMPMLGALMPLVTNSLGKNLGTFFADQHRMRKNAIYNKQELEAQAKQNLEYQNIKNEDLSPEERKIIELESQRLKYASVMSPEELNQAQERIIALSKEIALLKEKRKIIQDTIGDEETDPTATAQRETKDTLEQLIKQRNRTVSLKDQDPSLLEAEKELSVLQNSRNALNAWRTGPRKGSIQGASAHGISGLTKDSSQKEISAAARQRDREYKEQIQKQEEKIAQTKEALQNKIDEQERQIQILEQASFQPVTEMSVGDRAASAHKDAENLRDISKRAIDIATDVEVSPKGLDVEWKKINSEIAKSNNLMPKVKIEADNIEKELLELTQKGAKPTEEQLKKLQERIQNIASSCEDSGKELDDFASTLEKFAQEAEGLEEEIDNGASSFEEEYDHAIAKTTQTITNAVGALASLASAISMLQNVGNIWSDEDLTVGEKLLQTIPIVTSLIMMSIPIMEAVSATHKKHVAEYVAGEGAKQAANTATAATAWASLGPYALIAAVIVGIVAAVAVIASTVKKSESDLEKAQKAAEEAAAAAEEAAARANELQDAYNNIKSEIDGLIESRKAIDSMTEGTQEWKNAVLQLNSQVLELITKYPELVSMGAVSMKDGVYDIDEEAIEEFLKQEYSTVAAFSRLSNVSAINLAETRKNESQKETEDKINDGIKNLFTLASEDVFGINNGRATISADYFGSTNEAVLKSLSSLGLNTEYTDTAYVDTATIDLNSLYNLDDAGRETLLNAINSGDYGEEVEKFIQEAINVTKDNSDSMDTQNNLIDENTKAIYASIAAENGYDTEVFEAATKNIEKEDATLLNTDTIYEAGDWGGGSFFSVGKKAETDNQAIVAAKEINNQLEKILNPLKISWKKVTADDVKDKFTADMGETVTVTVDGQVMSVNSAFEYAAMKKFEKDTLEAAQDIEDLKNRNLNQNAWFFMDGRAGEGFTDATIDDYNQIIAQASQSGADVEKTSNAKNVFINRIRNTFGVSEEDAEKLYGNFTDEETTHFKELQGRFGSEYADQLNSVLGSVKNSEQMKRIYSAMKNINFNDSDSIADFFFKFTGDIQTKIAKRELDYFKNINKELDTIESKLENVFGLEKDLLLQRRVELEKQAKAQADANLKNANFVYGSYVNNYAADLKGYQNTDGSLDVTAVNDRIAEIMAANPNNYKDNEEYKKLSELSEHWDWVIESEQAAQEATYKVIDAQIEAFNYAYEVQKQINETLRQWRDFSREFKDDISDFDKSAGIAATDAAFAQISDGQLDFALAEDKILKYSKDIETIKEELTRDNNILKARIGIEEKALSTQKSTEETWDLLVNYGTLKDVKSGLFYQVYEAMLKAKEEAEETSKKREEAENAVDYISTESQFVSNGVFNSAAFFEAYQTEISSAVTALESAQAGIEALYESYLSIQDEILETYDKEIEKLSKINSILKGSADLAKMAGVDSSDFYGQMTANSGSSFAIAQDQLTDIQTQYTRLFDKDGKLIGSKEMADKVRDNLAAAGENVLSTAQEYYSSIAEQFSYELQKLFDDAAKGDLAGKTEAWELAVAQDQRYLDDVNEAYARGELDRRFKQSLEETDNISAQNKLLEAQRKIEAQLTAAREAQGKLRQADLDRANAEYDLALKRIALEEAQQASNKMQLTRDASGNYSYQFVADQDAIAKAEEELAAAENNLYNMDKERTQSLVSEYYSTMSEANSQIAEAMAANDQERVERLKDYYFGDRGLLKGIQSELGIATTGLNAMTGVYKDFTDSVLATDIGELGTNVGNAIATSASTMSELSSTINTLLGEGGVLSTLPMTLENAVIKAVDTSELTDKATDIVTQLPGLIEAVNTLKITLGGADGTGGYIQAFKDWVKDNQPTSTDDQLKNNVQGIYDVVSNGMALKAIDADNDGFLDSFELKANDTSGEN